MKMNLNRFDVVGATSVVLAVTHIATKKAGIDQNALTLLGFAAFCFLLPEFTGLVSRVKKVKMPWLEAEFDAEIQKFEAKVIEVEASQPGVKVTSAEEKQTQAIKLTSLPTWGTPHDDSLWTDTITKSKQEGNAGLQQKRSLSFPPQLHSSYVQEYSQIISGPSSHREKIVLAGILTERMILETAKELGLEIKARPSAGNAIRLLQKEGLVSDHDIAAFDEFWKIRNSVVHGEIQEITDRQSSRILDLLWRLVKVFG